MEASFDLLLNRSNPDKQRTSTTFVKTPAASSLQQGLRASVQKQQVIVPTCSTGRSASFKVPDNSSAVKKNIAPIAVVLSKDKRVSGNPNLFLSPFIFLSSDKTKKGTASSNASNKTQQAQSEKRPSLVAKKNEFRKPASKSTNQNSSIEISQREAADFRDERDSSVEAEDSLGTLLSKHFEAENNEDHMTSPSSEIAKRRLLHERARIRHICNVCNRECPSKHKLRRHLSTHSEDRPFACQVCGRTFKWTGYLQKHIRQQHSNCGIDVDVPPTSPLISPAPGQSQVTPDTPTFSASFTASPPTPSQTHTLTKPTHSHHHKKHKKHSKSSRHKSHSENRTLTLSECPLHRKRPRTDKNSSVTVIDADKDCQPKVKSLIVSIPKMYRTRTGVSSGRETQAQEMDALDITLEKINASAGQSGTTSNFPNAVSAIMAEPVPSCVQSNSMRALTSEMGASAANTNHSQGFGQGYPQYLPLSFTSNSADTFLSQDFDHTHLLNTSTASTLSTGYSSVPIQQDQLLSAQSDSNSMNMSNSIQTDKDPMTFPVQSSVDPLSQPQNQGSFSNSLQPPDLIQMPSQFDPLAPNMQFDHQLNDVLNYGYNDTLNNQCSMFGGNSSQMFDSDSVMDDLSLSGLGYMPSPNELGMFDNFMSSPSYMELQQARQLFHENTQQMRRILRSYQSLQNTLLRVTAGAMLPPGPAYNHGVMPQHQQASMPSLTTDPLITNQQVQLNSNVSNLQMPGMSQSGDHMAQHLQSHINTPQSHMTESQDLSHTHTQVTQTQDHIVQDFLSQTTSNLQLSNSTTDSHPPQPSTPAVETPEDIFDSSSQICEPDDLLAPITSQDDPEDVDLFPVEKKQRLDDDSLYDVGIQCELGPETLVALIEEEQQEGLDDSDQCDGLEQILTRVNLLSSEELSAADVSMETNENGSSQALSDSDQNIPPLIRAPLTMDDPEAQIDLTGSPATPDQDSSEPLKIDRMVNKYRCGAEGCGKAYMHRKDLTRHMKIRHGAYVMPKMLKPVAMETAEKPYICPVSSCGRSYHHLRDLRRHQRNCHDENAKAQTDSPETVKKDQTWEYNSIFGKIQLRFPCDYPGCVRSYVHKKDLVRHKRLYHKDSLSKPTIPVPVPYSDTDLRFIRQEVKQEVEQLMKKGRLDSNGSLCSSVSSTTSDSDVLSPDALLSTLNTDVFLSLGIAPPPLECDKNGTDVSVNNTAQIISLIQNLTTNNPQVGEVPIPQFPLPITVPMIPVVADSPLSAQSPVLTVPCSSNADDSESSGGKLKQVLSKPSKNFGPTTTSSMQVNSGETSTAVTTKTTEPSIDNILDISAQELVDSLKPQTQDQEGTKRSPDTLTNMAAAALSMPASSELSDMLIKTVSSSTSLCSPTVHTSSPIVLDDEVSPDQQVKEEDPTEPVCCSSGIGVLPELIEEPMEAECSPDTGDDLMDTVLAIKLMNGTQAGSEVAPELASCGETNSAIMT